MRMDDEAEEVESCAAKFPLICDDAFDEDNRLKRKRRDGCSSPANIDVSGLIGANSAVNDPSRQNRFSILADLEIENVGHVDNVKRNNNKEANGECNK